MYHLKKNQNYVDLFHLSNMFIQFLLLYYFFEAHIVNIVSFTLILLLPCLLCRSKLADMATVSDSGLASAHAMDWDGRRPWHARTLGGERSNRTAESAALGSLLCRTSYSSLASPHRSQGCCWEWEAIPGDPDWPSRFHRPPSSHVQSWGKLSTILFSRHKIKLTGHANERRDGWLCIFQFCSLYCKWHLRWVMNAKHQALRT